jgi:hypothetical protein
MKAFESGSNAVTPGALPTISVAAIRQFHRRAATHHGARLALSSIIKNARGSPELVGKRPRLFRAIRHKPVDRFVQFPNAVIGSIRRLTMCNRAVAVHKQHAGRLSD